MTMIRIHPQLSPFTMRRSQLFSSLDQGAGASRLEAGVDGSQQPPAKRQTRQPLRKQPTRPGRVFKMSIEVNKSGLVELIALRRVGPQWWDAMAGVSAGFREFRRLTLRSAPGWSQRDQHHQNPFGNTPLSTSSSQNSVNEPPHFERIALLQFRRQRLVGEILETHRPQEPLNGPCAH
jgi:hypothetical protein